MKELVNLLLSKNYIFKSLKEIDKRALGIRKRIDIYEGVDVNSYYVAIFILVQKSRFLKKNAKELDSLLDKIKRLQDHNYKRKVLIYQMPFCSKAKESLKESGWILIDASI